MYARTFCLSIIPLRTIDERSPNYVIPYKVGAVVRPFTSSRIIELQLS